MHKVHCFLVFSTCCMGYILTVTYQWPIVQHTGRCPHASGVIHPVSFRTESHNRRIPWNNKMFDKIAFESSAVSSTISRVDTHLCRLRDTWCCGLAFLQMHYSFNMYIHVVYILSIALLPSSAREGFVLPSAVLLASRGHRFLPFPLWYIPSFFSAHRVQHSHFSYFYALRFSYFFIQLTLSRFFSRSSFFSRKKKPLRAPVCTI